IGFDSVSARLLAAGSPLTAKREWLPIVPTAANGFGATTNLNNVPTVFAGTWGDTTVALDPAQFRGKVAVFLATPAEAGLNAGRGAAPVLRCDSVPNKFGAEAAAKVEAEVAAANAARGGRGGAGAGGRGGRGGAPGGRD